MARYGSGDNETVITEYLDAYLEGGIKQKNLDLVLDLMDEFVELKELVMEKKMSACDHCRYRHSWECDDGWNRRRNCSEFELDFSTLTNKQKKAIQRILDREDNDRDDYY